VTLQGAVGSWQEVEAAEEAVMEVPGVQEVLDELDVQAPKLDAAVLQGAVQCMLERHRGLSVRGIEITSDDGAITVCGPVHSWVERDLVLDLLWSTPGVRSVKDHMHIEGFRISW
jgi:osmotically-inducible protein OsmY